MVASRVFGHLVEDVLSGRYEPGEKLPTQRALAAELDVNMASVREAVKRLEQLGLVEVRQGDAMRVTDWRASGGLEGVGRWRSSGRDPRGCCRCSSCTPCSRCASSRSTTGSTGRSAITPTP